MTSLQMQLNRWVIVLILLPFITGCAGFVHKRFVQNFSTERQQTDGSFGSNIAKLKYNDKKQLLVLGLESGKIEIWDINKTHSKIDIKAHEYPADMISFTSDGTALFSSSRFEESTKLWNVKTGELIQTIRKMKGPVGRTPNQNIYVIANGDYVSLYNLSRELLLPEKYPCGGTVTSIATDDSSGLIAIGTEAGTVDVWKYTESIWSKSLVQVSSARPYTKGDWVIGLQFTSNGNSLYSVTRFGSIDEWDPNNFEKRRSVPTILKHIYSTSFDHEGNAFVLAGTKEMIGILPSTVEIVSLALNVPKVYYLNTNLAKVEVLPPLSAFIAVQAKSSMVRELPRNKWFW